MITRSWQQIQAQIKSAIAANSTLNTVLTSSSQVSHWQLWTFIQALVSNLNEQAAKIFIGEIETIIAQGQTQTAIWIQQQILKFQYSTKTPYLLSDSNGILGYSNVVVADRIISNCAVVETSTGAIRIKITTGSPAGPLSANQLIALNSYLINFLAPNQKKSLISVVADKLWVAGTVYFNGQLNASIVSSVTAALQDYITKFSTSQSSGGSFNGLVKASEIEKIILGVTGVVDWVPSQITVTPVVGSPANLILANVQLLRSYNSYSGYVVNDPGNPFSSTLTFVAAAN